MLLISRLLAMIAINFFIISCMNGSPASQKFATCKKSAIPCVAKLESASTVITKDLINK